MEKADDPDYLAFQEWFPADDMGAVRGWAGDRLIALSAWCAALAYARREAEGHAMVTVPTEPSPGLLASMALRYDHGVFMPADPTSSLLPVSEEARARRINSIITTMRQIHEEVVGLGFYRPEREATYAARLPAKD